jgi:hypothetical protein
LKNENPVSRGGRRSTKTGDGPESKERDVASQRARFDMGWARKNGWYIVIGLIILYWILKLFIFG